jgi:SpoVK/Ycf46/Vps4 family AAA+-type ATPase
MFNKSKNASNINEYNKFLILMDKKQIEAAENKNIIKNNDNINDSIISNDSKINNDNINDSIVNDSIVNDSIVNNDSKIDNDKINNKNIDDVLKEIEQKYINNKCNSINFAGWGDYDIIKSKIKTNDENTYIDHDTKRSIKKPVIPKQKIVIETEIKNIDCILKLIDTYKLDDNIEYNINMNILHNIKEPLIELNSMIGMNLLKSNILDQILYFAQEMHISEKGNGDFMHTVIYGPPGTGKTEIAKIMGKIYSKMGILKAGTFKKVIRADLISGYLGQTALKTKDVIKSALGGVLFIDEAYALGNPEKRDSFSKECIDTLCEGLSDHKDNLMVIIAGYETEMKECFFSYNPGLESRFTWRFKTDKYKAEDLKNIFVKKVNTINWTIEEIDTKWFEKNLPYFKFYGRDIEVLLSKIKIAHSKRVFCKPNIDKKRITLEDMENGLKMFLQNDDVSSRKEEEYRKKSLYNSMYV